MSEIPGVRMEYQRRGEVFVSNTGLREGFVMCQTCGYLAGANQQERLRGAQLLHDRRRVCGGDSDRFHLGYRFATDVLILSFQFHPRSRRAMR